MSTDFQGTFQKKFHAKVIPGLLSILDDHDNPRTQAHGGAALVNFSEDCPPRLLIEHLPQIIEKLEQVLSRKYQEVNFPLVRSFVCSSNDLFSSFIIIEN